MPSMVPSDPSLGISCNLMTKADTHFSAMKTLGQTSSTASLGVSSLSFTSALCKSITHGVLNKLVSSIFSLTRLYRSSTISCCADSNILGHSESTLASFVFSSGIN